MKKQLTIKQVLQQVKEIFRVDLTELSPEEILGYFDGHGRFFFNESGSYHKSEEAFDIGDPRLVDVAFDPIVKEALADKINECYGGERMRREHSGFDDDPVEEEDGRLVAFLNLTNHELDLRRFTAICADLAKHSGTRIDVKMDWAFNVSTVTMTIDEKGEVQFDGAMTLPLDNRENFAFGIARGLELFGDSTLEEMEQSGFAYEYDDEKISDFTIGENEYCYRYALLAANEPERLKDKNFVLGEIPTAPVIMRYLDNDIKYDKDVFAEFMKYDMPLLAACYKDLVGNDSVVISHYGAIAKNRANLIKGVVDDFASVFDMKKLGSDLDYVRLFYDNYMLVNLFAPQNFDPALDNTILKECSYFIRVVLHRNEDLMEEDKKLRERYCVKYELDEKTDLTVLSILKTLDDVKDRDDFIRLFSELISAYSPEEYDGYRPFFESLSPEEKRGLAHRYLAFARFFRAEISPLESLAKEIEEKCPHAWAILSDECRLTMDVTPEETEAPIEDYCRICGKCIDTARPAWRMK